MPNMTQNGVGSMVLLSNPSKKNNRGMISFFLFLTNLIFFSRSDEVIVKTSHHTSSKLRFLTDIHEKGHGKIFKDNWLRRHNLHTSQISLHCKIIFNVIVVASHNEDGWTVIWLIASASWPRIHNCFILSRYLGQIENITFRSNENERCWYWLVLALRKLGKKLNFSVKKKWPKQKYVLLSLKVVEIAEMLIWCKLILRLLKIYLSKDNSSLTIVFNWLIDETDIIF